jgi:hypothetical protein
MFKTIKTLLISLLALFLFAGGAYAATSVRVEAPTSPTNKDNFNLTFVALDTESTQTVNVNCYKKGPSDSGYSVFKSFSLVNGGNTDRCQVTSDVVNQGNGTYSFYVTADGTSNATSATVSIDYNSSTPGTPVNFNKSKQDDCTYKITFKTANDSGKTVKVVLYRTSDLSLVSDSWNQVGSIGIGSDADGSMTDNVSPNCSKSYYYIVRAFDVYGNGSDSVGDSGASVTVVNPTGTSQAGQGAIPVTSGGGSVLGTETQTGEVLGTEKTATKPGTTETVNKAKGAQSTSFLAWVATHKKISLSVIVILLIIVYFFYRRYRK